MRVREVASGQDTGDELRWVKFNRPAWHPDGRGFWYGRYPEPRPGAELSAANVDMTLWFHPECAAHKRPEPFLEALAESGADVPDAGRLAELARSGTAHRRLPRIDGAERSPNARARCRSCREPIPKGEWRISLVFYQDGRFEPSGYIHAKCAQEYFGTTEVAGRIGHFADLSPGELSELEKALGHP